MTVLLEETAEDLLKKNRVVFGEISGVNHGKNTGGVLKETSEWKIPEEKFEQFVEEALKKFLENPVSNSWKILWRIFEKSQKMSIRIPRRIFDSLMNEFWEIFLEGFLRMDKFLKKEEFTEQSVAEIF